MVVCGGGGGGLEDWTLKYTVTMQSPWAANHLHIQNIVLGAVLQGGWRDLVGSKFGVGNLAFQIGRPIHHAKSGGFCQISRRQTKTPNPSFLPDLVVLFPPTTGAGSVLQDKHACAWFFCRKKCLQ